MKTPIFSIVIPTYNRSEALQACLKALQNQTHPLDSLEVIVVMDGTTDDTQSRLAGMEQPYALRPVWQPNGGAGAARNHGARLARAEWVVFLDDDMLPDAGLLDALRRAAQAHGPAVLLGQVVTRLAPGADWFAQEFGREWVEHYAALGRGQRAPTWQDCYAGNLAVPRAALQQCGGWPEDLPRNEDLEVGYRLQKLGLPLIYVPEALTIQTETKGFKELTRDVGQAGPATAVMAKRHPELLPSQLGRFGETTRLDMLARRALLAGHMPLAPLDWVGRLIGKHEGRWRWYRFVYSYAYWRGVRQAMAPDEWRRLTSGTVILMYHAFGYQGEAAAPYRTPARRFAQHMAWLKFWGYNVMSLADYLACRRQYCLPPARSIVITIDDGYADSFALALPILRHYGFPATIFLVSQRIGHSNQWDRDRAPDLTGRPLLTREQILEMYAAGITFGVHARTHRPLIGLPEDELRTEIVTARDELEKMLGFPISVFSYPYGAVDDNARALVAEAGFAGAVGTQPQKNYASTPLLELRRVAISGQYHLLDFITSVWMGGHRQ